jgi:hypothetical protein
LRLNLTAFCNILNRANWNNLQSALRFNASSYYSYLIEILSYLSSIYHSNGCNIC